MTLKTEPQKKLMMKNKIIATLLSIDVRISKSPTIQTLPSPYI